MITLLRLKLAETLRAVAPLIGVVCMLQFTVVGASPAVFLPFLAGSTLVTHGMLFLQRRDDGYTHGEQHKVQDHIARYVPITRRAVPSWRTLPGRRASHAGPTARS